MAEHFSELEQIVENEILEENPEHQDEYLEENLEHQDECEPNVEDPYVKQLAKVEIQNAIEGVKVEPDELKVDEPQIVELEREFANAKVVRPDGPFIIRYIKD